MFTFAENSYTIFNVFKSFTIMKDLKKKKLIDYPSYFSNTRVDALDNALELFMEAFDEYSRSHNLSAQEIRNFKEIIIRSYLERKAEYFIQDKISNFSDYLDTASNLAARNSFDSEDVDSLTKILYYRNNKHLIFND